VRLCVWWLYKNKVKNIFSRGNEKDFIQRAQQWWNFNNSKLSKKTFFAKMLVGKYEISKSRGRFKTFLNKITTCQPASFQCSANPRLVLFICYSASDVWLWRQSDNIFWEWSAGKNTRSEPVFKRSLARENQ